jgi:hypothetical protein
MAGIFRGSVYFVLGAATGVAAQRLWQRYTKEAGKDGTQLLVQGVGAALAAGREMTRKAARFMEEVEDIVAEAQAMQETPPPPPGASKEPAPNGAERV